nr:DddA-like double-stranded DNA deaminase toxin [Amycolatopsis balhimycina]
MFGCDTLLPVILPKGYSLTVHAPNYRKTFTGGK